MSKFKEERWTPFSLDTDMNLIRFLEEMSDIGLQMEWVYAYFYLLIKIFFYFWAVCHSDSSSSSDFKYRFALNVSQSACMFARTAIQLS